MGLPQWREPGAGSHDESQGEAMADTPPDIEIEDSSSEDPLDRLEAGAGVREGVVGSDEMTTGVQQYPHLTSTDNAPTSGLTGTIGLESRLADHVPLAPEARAYLPAALSDYEVAVCTGFPNFEYRSRHPLLEQGYAALRTGNPGEGAQADPTVRYVAAFTRTVGDQKYEFTHNPEDHPLSFRAVSVGNISGASWILQGHVERPEEPEASCQRLLTVKLQGVGKYQFVRTHTIHEVTIKSERDRQVFRNMHWYGHDGSRDVMEGAIPPWQGLNGQAR